MMENGHGGKLAEKMSGLGLNDSDSSSNLNFDNATNNDSLFQVMKAVEAAEATIKQQVDENTRLRSELRRKIQELEQLKSGEQMTQRSHSVDPWNGQADGPYEIHQLGPFLRNQENKVNSMRNDSATDPSGTLVLHQDSKPKIEDPTTRLAGHNDSGKSTGTLKAFSGAHAPDDNATFSRHSSPSMASFSPSRYQMDREYDSQFNVSGHGLQMAEVNGPGSLWKQDFVLKIREHEEEIMQLRKHLADYSVKEAQIRNEKYVLEKRIAHMRLAFDQQQQDLVDAASKALSYRQDIMEENVRLTYALQAAQQERTTFVSSLLPLLAEYSLQPPVLDAQSIVSNVKVLFRHLQEKLVLTESKLKESQYQLAPWPSDGIHSNFAPQSPSHSLGAGLMALNKDGLQLVPQPTYSHGKGPVSSDGQPAVDWDLVSHHQSGFGGTIPKNQEPDDVGRYSPLASRNAFTHDIQANFASTRSDAHATHLETTNKQAIFHDPAHNNDMDDPEAEGRQNDTEPSGNWGSGNSPSTVGHDDPGSSYSPYLPPVLEEPSSSFSEAADDDPLPAIDGLQISGEAFPGRELQACGYSINGTTSCNFEWVRHLEDGSVKYIDGAKQPSYLVTADDVQMYLAIEVQPLDDRKRKGELVKVFANGHQKITCDPEMQNHIERTLYSGHVTYKVSLSTGFLDIWEPATLVIKREGYSIKRSGNNGLITEKFSPTTNVTISHGHASEFIIIGPNGVEHLLRTDNNSTDISCSRDAIVLTLRLFVLRAGQRRKGKKRGIFFNK